MCVRQNCGMYEWANEWTYEWAKEWMNEWMNGGRQLRHLTISKKLHFVSTGIVLQELFYNWNQINFGKANHPIVQICTSSLLQEPINPDQATFVYLFNV